MNVGRWIYKRSLISPYKTAIVFKDVRVSYDGMNRRINKLCHALIETGNKKGRQDRSYQQKLHSISGGVFRVL